MFRRILIGADGSPEGLDAVTLGATIASITGAQVKVVDDARSARELRVHAEHWHADLIVIGSSRRLPSGHSGTGELGRYLLRKTPAALAIASRGLREREHDLSTILVGYDGGTESELALRTADELAIAARAELVIETIYEEPIAALVLGQPSTPGVVAELREDERRAALVIAERAVARSSPRSRLNVCVGDPGVELRRASGQADLTVIGSRRRGPLARVLLGGAGATLASDCGSSLIVVPRASAAELWPELLRDSPAPSETPSARREPAPEPATA